MMTTSFTWTNSVCLMSSASILSAAMSLTMTATLSPSRFSKIRFNKVVLPAPKKPDKRVTGITFNFGFLSALVVELYFLVLLRSFLSFLFTLAGISVAIESMSSIFKSLDLGSMVSQPVNQ